MAWLYHFNQIVDVYKRQDRCFHRQVIRALTGEGGAADAALIGCLLYTSRCV